MRPVRFMPCLLALWAFALVPTTCGGGVLAHPCEGDADPVCHHEESCPADPCNVVSIIHAAPDKGRAGADIDLPAPSPATTDDCTRLEGIAPFAWVSPDRSVTFPPLRC